MGVLGCDSERSRWQDTQADSVFPCALAMGAIASIAVRPSAIRASSLRMEGRSLIFGHFDAQKTLSPGIFLASGFRVGLRQGKVDLEVVGLRLQSRFQMLDRTF